MYARFFRLLRTGISTFLIIFRQVAHSGSKPQMSSPPNPKYVQPHLHSPASEPQGVRISDVVHAPLSADNYKSKFTELLKLEEKEQIRVLKEK